MSKLLKLLSQLSPFFAEATPKRKKGAKSSSGGSLTFVLAPSDWMSVVRLCFPERQLVFLPESIEKRDFGSYQKVILQQREPLFLICETSLPSFLEEFLEKHRISRRYIEGGPLSSMTRSVCIDSKGLYSHAGKATDLEDLLQTHPFDEALIIRARSGIASLLKMRPSHPDRAMPSSEEIKARKRVLVLGEVKGDAFVRMGCDRPIVVSDLIRLAAEEHPEAEIICRLEGDGVTRHRQSDSDLKKVRHLCTVLDQKTPLVNALEGVDQAYTISSLGGFEALLRGIKVTTLGSPFYSGWGLTDDRQQNPRRTRMLSVEELFAGACILYPSYVNLKTGARETFEESLSAMTKEAKQITKTPGKDRMVKTPEKPPVSQGKAASPPVDRLDWYRHEEESSDRECSLPVYLHLPWDRSEDFDRTAIADPRYRLVAFDLFKGIENPHTRRAISHFASESPALYRKMVLSRLIPWRGKVAGFLYSFDSAPAMRIVVWACRELGIPTILIPQESGFGARTLQYLDPKGIPKCPATDFVLGWGEEQREVFVERGYPAERFFKMGSPQLERGCLAPKLDRETFCALFALDPASPIILFMAVAYPAQASFKPVRDGQRNAIRAIARNAAQRNWQLLVRMPSCNRDVLGEILRSEIAENPHCAIDDAVSYLVTLDDAQVQSDWIVSCHGAALLRAFLSGLSTIAVDFVRTEGVEQSGKIPVVTSEAELVERLAQRGTHTAPSPEALQWAAQAFSTGAVEGSASQRICDWLADFAGNVGDFATLPPPRERVFDPNGGVIDVAVIHSPSSIMEKAQKYLPKLLNVRSLLYMKEKEFGRHLDSIELFVQWGITPSLVKDNQIRHARELGRARVIVEDGFIRSVDIGLSGEPGLSIILDNLTAYYDATRPSRLAGLLESGPELGAEAHRRAAAAIAKIVKARVSKYNHAPDFPIRLGEVGRPKILLVDQRFGDQSVTSGLADEETFRRMLEEAMQRSGECDVIIKQHPDALKGGKLSYLNNELVGPYAARHGGVYIVDFDVNPYALFDAVDEVYVVTSGMGFEALMAGKKVHCYGAPFYAGWGLTQDRLSIPGRGRQRSLEALFHYAYIVSSRYYDPVKERRVEVEEIVEYIEASKARSGIVRTEEPPILLSTTLGAGGASEPVG